MQRGRVVHNTFIRCREKNIDLELDTLMVSLITEMIEKILIICVKRGLLAPHEINEMMVKAHDMKVR